MTKLRPCVNCQSISWKYRRYGGKFQGCSDCDKRPFKEFVARMKPRKIADYPFRERRETASKPRRLDKNAWNTPAYFWWYERTHPLVVIGIYGRTMNPLDET